MAERINVTSTNETDILQQYLIQKVCKASATYCQGDDQQYESYEACTAFLLTRPLGQWYRMGGKGVKLGLAITNPQRTTSSVGTSTCPCCPLDQESTVHISVQRAATCA